jgi:hypothetical protein
MINKNDDNNKFHHTMTTLQKPPPPLMTDKILKNNTISIILAIKLILKRKLSISNMRISIRVLINYWKL